MTFWELMRKKQQEMQKINGFVKPSMPVQKPVMPAKQATAASSEDGKKAITAILNAKKSEEAKEITAVEEVAKETTTIEATETPVEEAIETSVEEPVELEVAADESGLTDEEMANAVEAEDTESVMEKVGAPAEEKTEEAPTKKPATKKTAAKKATAKKSTTKKSTVKKADDK